LPSELVGLSGMRSRRKPWKPLRCARSRSSASTNWPCNCHNCAVS
jgi:hypothetical protein